MFELRESPNFHVEETDVDLDHFNSTGIHPLFFMYPYAYINIFIGVPLFVILVILTIIAFFSAGIRMKRKYLRVEKAQLSILKIEEIDLEKGLDLWTTESINNSPSMAIGMAYEIVSVGGCACYSHHSIVTKKADNKLCLYHYAPKKIGCMSSLNSKLCCCCFYRNSNEKWFRKLVNFLLCYRWSPAIYPFFVHKEESEIFHTFQKFFKGKRVFLLQENYT